MFALADQLMELTKDKTWQARIVEAARTVFQDEHVNVNPIPAVMCELQQISSFLVFITSFLLKGPIFIVAGLQMTILNQMVLETIME